MTKLSSDISNIAYLKNEVIRMAEKNGFSESCYKIMLDYTINNLQSSGLGEKYYGYHNIDHLLEIPLGVLLVGDSKQIPNLSSEDLKYLFVSAIFHDFEPDKIIDKPSEDNVLKNLNSLIDEFIKNAKNQGIEVFFAKDANAHNEIVLNELKKINAKKVVKSKSMLTEECGLNEFLEKEGIEVIDTDLGERIVQLRGEKPSHIVLPAIHTTKEDVAEILNETNTDPTFLTHKMRKLLRDEFLSADAGVSGANFLVANKGWAVVCTNEGNADLGAILPKLHIISVGIEKIVPSMQDLGVFLSSFLVGILFFVAKPITSSSTGAVPVPIIPIFLQQLLINL